MKTIPEELHPFFDVKNLDNKGWKEEQANCFFKKIKPGKTVTPKLAHGIDTKEWELFMEFVKNLQGMPMGWEEVNMIINPLLRKTGLASSHANS